MKKLLTTTIFTLLCSVSLYSADFVLKFSHVVTSETPKGKAALFFEKRLEELSKGKIDVEVYPSSMLYGDKDIIKAVKLNVIQMACPTFSKFSSLVPQLAVFDLPFLFRDIDHLHNVQDSQIGDNLKEKIEKFDLHALDFWDNNFKQISTSNDKAILKPSDIKGQKFRIMNSNVLKEQFKAFDAIPEVIPFSKVHKALASGKIDGQENTNSNIYTKRFYEVQKNLTLTNHGYLGYLVVISKKFWDKLPSNLQKNLKQAMKEATVKERAYAEELNTIQLNKIKEYARKTKSLKIHTLSQTQTKHWREAVKPLYAKFYDESIIGEKLIRSIKNTQ